MKINALFSPLQELESFVKTKDVLLDSKAGKQKTVLCTGVIDSQKCHLAAALCGNKTSQAAEKPLVFVTFSEVKAQEIFEDLKFFMSETHEVRYYPVRDMLFYSADVKSSTISKQRFSVINSLIANEKPIALSLSLEALFDRLTEKSIFEKYILTYNVGDVLSIRELTEKLIHMGYERTEIVESAGQFTVRGGIIDLFSCTQETAVRIELWGDEIDSIRAVDPVTQRSIDKQDSVTIFPMRDLVFDEETLNKAVQKITKELSDNLKKSEKNGLTETFEQLEKSFLPVIESLRENKSCSAIESFINYFYEEPATLLDYLQDDTILVFDEPVRLRQHSDVLFQEWDESMQNRLLKGYLLPSQTKIIEKYESVLHRSEKFARVLFSTLITSIKDFRLDANVSYSVKSSGIFHGQINLLEEDLKHYISQNYRILLLAGGQTRAERVTSELNSLDITAKTIDLHDDGDYSLPKETVILSGGSISKGFDYPLIKLLVISGKELFDSHKKKKRKTKKSKGAQINTFADLTVGDYVVHDKHGIGVYRGIEKIMVDNVGRDFLKISYKDGGNLYVSTTQLDLLQKYIGGEESKPKLNKLGGQEWNKAKSRVKGAVEILAKDLIALYAKREAAVGFTYNKDSVWQKEFEELFPYDETDDQLNAIDDVKRDMESRRVMDRLICGDVGYGKTEIAIRAAFKAVQDGKQVAYLVPTTILAQQHYNTFVQRMKDFPVNVALLSRFRTPKQQAESLSGLAKGKVDIVIGTHRLLSTDVVFKDLGLIIVDEEQRFGVTHKEKLKRIRENVDVLTLTATPIPRTLHMSLSGIRDMSVLEEPPEERLPIQTYVMEYNPEFVREAIHRELGRGGQVYYLHNRVRNIADVALKIQQLVPDANVAFAHGQMSERELESIMMDFIEGEIDVLVCTTIIETGLDISNVNTIIIQDADYMGLSQLYQLRGRVGRSSRTSFAYLMYKKDKVLTEIAEKRLQTIREFTEFGSGFKIAMRDLEIRGAGNLLGAEQHGHMDIVGYDMYCKLLGNAVSELKGEKKAEEFETFIDINVNAFIPPYYISNELQKLEVYKKISYITNSQDYYDTQEEIEDRFGNLPPSVQILLDIALLKAVAHKAFVISIVQQKTHTNTEQIVITFKGDAAVDPLKIAGLVEQNKKYTFKIAPNPYLTYKLDENEVSQFIIKLKEQLETLIPSDNI